MSLRRWNPWEQFVEIQKEINATFDRFFATTYAHKSGRKPAFAPPVDIYETEKSIIVRVGLPGALEEDIDIIVDGGKVIIRGEANEPLDAVRDGFLHREWRYGYFEREIRLPAKVDTEKSAATYESGVLQICFRKQ